MNNYFHSDYFGNPMSKSDYEWANRPSQKERAELAKEERNQKWIRIRKKIELRNFTEDIVRGYFLKSLIEFNKKYIGYELLSGYELCLYLLNNDPCEEEWN